MLRQIAISAIISIVCLANSSAQKTNSCSIEISCMQFSRQTLKIGYYYGTKTLLLDSIQLNDNGLARINNLFHQGIYVLVLPNGNHFEFMTDCSSSVYLEMLEDVKVVNIKGNEIAEGYYIYQENLRNTNILIDSLKTLAAQSDNEKLKARLREKIALVKDSIDSRNAVLGKTYAGTLLGNYLKSVQRAHTTEMRNPGHTINPDSLLWISRLQYYQQHYLDNLVFTDPGLIYTPVLEDKITKYLDKIIEQEPRRKAEQIDLILNKAMDPEVYRFILEMLYKNYVTTLYQPENEFLFLHILSKYYLKGKAPWLNDQEIKQLSSEYNHRQASALFQKAPEIVLKTPNGTEIALSSLNSTYTLIVFWDYTCEHCRHALDDIINTYTNYPEVNLTVYAVYTGDDMSIWKAFIEKKLPKAWINVSIDSKQQVLIDYNITKLPGLFLLNENKLIIDKGFTASQFGVFLESTRQK